MVLWDRLEAGPDRHPEQIAETIEAYQAAELDAVLPQRSLRFEEMERFAAQVIGPAKLSLGAPRWRPARLSAKLGGELGGSAMNKTLLTTLFSFEGRMRRSHFWAVRFGSVFALGLVWMVYGLIVGLFRGDGHGAVSGVIAVVGGIVILAAFIAYLWADLAASVKRCHDRDKTGWFLLIGLIPLIGGIWLLIELGFLDGAPGSNKYGPSPKFPETAATVFA